MKAGKQEIMKENLEEILEEFGEKKKDGRLKEILFVTGVAVVLTGAAVAWWYLVWRS